MKKIDENISLNQSSHHSKNKYQDFSMAFSLWVTSCPTSRYYSAYNADCKQYGKLCLVNSNITDVLPITLCPTSSEKAYKPFEKFVMFKKS